MDVTKPYEFKRFGAMDVTKPYKFIRFGAMYVTKPYNFRGFGAMDVTKPYKFIRFVAMHVTKPYKFIKLGAMDVTKPCKFISGPLVALEPGSPNAQVTKGPLWCHRGSQRTQVGDLWMWLQLMWLQFEVVRGPVGVVWGSIWGRFGILRDPN
jgi:hypothetical protein